MKGYIFIVGEGEQVFRTPGDLTPEDFAHAAVGTLVIIRLADGHFFGRAGRWLPIPLGACGRAAVDGRGSAPFHRLPGDFDS